MFQWFLWGALAVVIHAQTLNVVQNEFIKIITGPEGFDHPRFSIETTGGDPSRDEDNDLPLIYGRPKPWTSYTSIAVDGTVYGFGTQTVKRAGKRAKYGQVIASSVTKNAMETVAIMGPIKGTQTLTLFRNPITNVEDSVLIEYRLLNVSDATKNVGLRMMMDTMLGTNDAAPFRIGNDAVQAETSYRGDAIMDYWQSFDSLATPNIIAQGILRYTPASLTPPDELILMNWGALADAPYRVKVNKGDSFIRDGEDEPDTALALFYEKRPLGPNEARVYRTVMGLGGVSLAPGDLALGITAPSYISVTDPNIYTMVAYISNTGGFSASSANATIALPQGLTLVTGNQTESLGDILTGGSRQLVYFVKMDPINATEGPKTITFTVTSNTLPDQVLVREMVFTGQPKLTLRGIGNPTIQRGFDQFVDVPVELRNESDVTVSNITLSLNAAKSPFSMASFDQPKQIIPVLGPHRSKQVSWKLKVDEWHGGTHNIPIQMKSVYTKPVTSKVPVQIKLGKPKAKLYYSDPSFFVGDFGYVWITLMDMPTFSGLNLTLTWEGEYLAPVRVSPEPWLIESVTNNAMEMFSATHNALQITGLAAKDPPWRMIIGKWHFKVIEEGDVTVRLWQGAQQLDELTIVLRRQEQLFENEKEEKDFDF
jgi:hypothetical protein